MLLLPVLWLVASATPDATTVVVTRRTAVSAAEALAVCGEVSRALKAAGVQVTVEPAAAARSLATRGVKDTAACQGRLQCIVEFGRQLGVELVVSVSISEFEGDRSVVLEPYRVSTGAVLAKGTLLYRAGARPPPQDLSEFAQRTAAALAADRAPPAASPVEAAPVPAPGVAAPAPAPEPALWVPPAAAPQLEAKGHSRAPGVVLGTLGFAAAIASGVLAITGSQTRGKLDAATMGGRSTLSGSAADRLVRSANTQFTASGVCGLVGLGFGVSAVIVW